MSGAEASRPEFSRTVDARAIPGHTLDLVASPAECAALARRFALVSVDRLSAHVDLTRDGDAIDAVGRLSAAIVQSCALSGGDLPVGIDAPLRLRFVPEALVATPGPDDIVELAADDPDEIPYAGTAFDLGEAVAQSLALGIDPFATGPEADIVRASGLLGGDVVSPFAGLAALKGKLAED